MSRRCRRSNIYTTNHIIQIARKIKMRHLKLFRCKFNINAQKVEKYIIDIRCVFMVNNKFILI